MSKRPQHNGGSLRGLSYQKLLDTDTHPVPDVLRLESPIDGGPPTRIPRERYVSQAIHDLEMRELWGKV